MDEKKKILIIDSDEADIFFMSSFLRKKGFQVAVAQDGVKAFEFIRSEKFDIVTTEIMLPSYDGLELIGIFRQEKGYENIPIIVITAQILIGSLRSRCFDIGATDCIQKPFKNADFLDKIKKYLEK